MLESLDGDLSQFLFPRDVKSPDSDLVMVLYPSRWSLTLQIIASSFHSVAIASTIFRLFYRWCMANFWWEDGWAVLALALDMLCLVSTWLEPPATTAREMPPMGIHKITNWIDAMAFPSTLWVCRISILLSIVRIARPSRQVRCVAFLVGLSFLFMWAALIGQRIHICLQNGCIFSASIGLSQLITDVIADLALVLLPIHFLRKIKINYQQRVMIFSAFSASLLITVISIFHSVVLFTVRSNGTVVIGHVKAALSLIICNLLVIVAFVYRMCRRDSDLDDAEDTVVFTTVDLSMCMTDSAADKRIATFIQHSMVEPEMSRLEGDLNDRFRV